MTGLPLMTLPMRSIAHIHDGAISLRYTLATKTGQLT